MRTLKLTIAYDGTRFVGWQRQAGRESIQGLLERALARFEGGPVVVHGAGRTDAGVHALAQVASVRLACTHDTAAMARGLNAQLPPDVRVTRLEEAADRFHARYGARAKAYRYLLRNAPVASPFERPYVWHVPEPLDVDAMRIAAASVGGTHDFAAFRSTGSDPRGTVRTITRSELVSCEPCQAGLADLTQSAPPPSTSHQSIPGPLLAYEIEGNGFLRHMVRSLVGTLVEIGRRRRSPDSMAALVAGGIRADAGATAPAHGLFLVRVDYD
ncbi:MAG: tRNA pseudouridine(38-40) synthase TruA [Acidobacteria bacterium]|nr:tRNA pseudouridine(38-40) synthase TruA [Acidobacteriota bacterium]